MTPDEAVRVIREQTIPALRGSGGDGHADALDALLTACEERGREVEQLRAELLVEQKRLAHTAKEFAERGAEISRLRAECETWLKRSTTAEAEAEYQTERAEQAEARLARVVEALQETAEGGKVLRPAMYRIERALAAAQPEGPTAEEAERCRKTPGPCTCGAHRTELGDWPHD